MVNTFWFNIPHPVIYKHFTLPLLWYLSFQDTHLHKWNILPGNTRRKWISAMLVLLERNPLITGEFSYEASNANTMTSSNGSFFSSLALCARNSPASQKASNATLTFLWCEMALILFRCLSFIKLLKENWWFETQRRSRDVTLMEFHIIFVYDNYNLWVFLIYHIK